MIKYYKELEHSKTFTIPLMYKKSEAKFDVFNGTCPTSFFAKYSDLFSSLKALDSFISIFNYKSMPIDFNCCSQIFPNNNLARIYDELYGSFESIMIEEYPLIKDLWNKINLTAFDVQCLLQFYLEFIQYLLPFYHEMNFNYDGLCEKLIEALNEIKNYTHIDIFMSLQHNLTLPNAWFITPHGILWNTGNDIKEEGHQQQNLINPYLYVKNMICSNKPIDRSCEQLECYRRIKSNGYITYSDFKHYLNYFDYPVSFDCLNEGDCYSEYRVFESRIVNSVLGVCSAQISFYKFFEDLQKYTDNPKYELDKLLNMVAGDLLDICVRCAGFHRVDVSGTKTIATSSVHYISDFSEYLRRGWNVSYTSPIVINKEKGTLELLDSLIVNRYMEKETEKYEKNKVKGYGKIF